MPVTRVYDATSLDSLGLPVWAAVTPLARDLTVHAGKGTTPVAARISAVMEAIERVSAESVDRRRVRTASFAGLTRRDPGGVIDPELFDLPYQTTYDPLLALSWISGSDLLAQRDVWVPLDLVISPASEGICTGVETNGLAAGNTYTEAVVHGLYEVIERDAAAHERFARLYADPSLTPPIRVVDPDSLPATPAGLVGLLRERGVRVTIENLAHDLDVPVFRATISDRSFPGREGTVWRFEGLGCDLDAERAVTRAITEAGQSHTVFLVGARDAFEHGQRQGRRTHRADSSVSCSRPHRSSLSTISDAARRTCEIALRPCSNGSSGQACVKRSSSISAMLRSGSPSSACSCPVRQGRMARPRGDPR